MALIDLKSDLKTLKYSEFGTIGDPLVVKDINDPPKYNSISKQVTARTDDLLRMTRLLVLQGGKRNPAGNKFTANLALINQQQTLSKLNKGERPNLQDIKAGLADTGKTLLGVLAQVPVTGTGVHFIYPPAVGNQYLKNSQGDFSALSRIGAAAGIGSGDGVNGAALALQGKKIIPDNEPFESRTGTQGTRIPILFRSDLDNEPANVGNVSSILEKKESILNTGTESVVSRKDNSKRSAIGFFDSEFTKKPSETIRLKLSNLGTNNPSGLSGNGQKAVLESAVNTWGGFGDPESNDFLTQEIPGILSDIIPFEFQVFDPQKGGLPQFLYFKAYIDSFSDSYTGDWNSTKYIGRAEELYNYTGFKRGISIGFKIAATTKNELVPLYRKLNFLVGTTAPSYNTNQTFMRGVFTRVTVGDYLVRVPGFFTSISLTWNVSYPWEIGYDENYEESIDRQENLLPRNPTVLEVNLDFTPVHDFNPAINQPFIGSTR